MDKMTFVGLTEHISAYGHKTGVASILGKEEAPVADAHEQVPNPSCPYRIAL
jgi:hypothetical protein